MNKFIKKLKQIELEISKEKGKFTLFALFQPEKNSLPNEWDLLVAADWIKNYYDTENGEYICKKIQNKFKKDEITYLQKVVIIDNKNPELKNIHNTIEIEHGDKQLINTYFFESIISRAYFITSQK